MFTCLICSNGLRRSYLGGLFWKMKGEKRVRRRRVLGGRAEDEVMMVARFFWYLLSFLSQILMLMMNEFWNLLFLIFVDDEKFWNLCWLFHFLKTLFLPLLNDDKLVLKLLIFYCGLFNDDDDCWLMMKLAINFWNPFLFLWYWTLMMRMSLKLLLICLEN